MNVYSYTRVMVFLVVPYRRDNSIFLNAPVVQSSPTSFPPKLPAGQIVWTFIAWAIFRCQMKKIPQYQSRRELNTYLSFAGGGTSIHFSILWECLFALKRPGFFRQVMKHTCS